MSLDAAFDQEKSLDAAFDAEGGGAPRSHPNEDARTNPRSPERTLLDRFLNPPGNARGGSLIGGTIGGLVGGLPGAMVGSGLGNLAGQNPLSPQEQGLRPPGLAGLRSGARSPEPQPYTPDYAAAGMDAAAQGVLGLGMKGLGRGAAKLGFPRVAGLLGAKPPQQAVLDVAPKGATSISTPALQRIEGTAAVEGAPAAKLIGATDAELSRQEATMARLAEKSKDSMGGIQSRMAARDTSELLPKTQAFSKALDSANIPEGVRRAAFSDAPSIEEAAVNPGVRSARQDLVTAAVPQRADANALKNASRFIANAEARGVTGPASRYAGEASGLTALTGKAPGNVEWLNAIAQKAGVPRAVSGAASSFLPSGGLSPSRVVQTTGALLKSRGEPLIDPALEKILSSSPAYKGGAVLPPGVEDLLRRFGSR